jgi:hypothetical protein
MGKRRVSALTASLIVLVWLCLMAYVWLWSRPEWGLGWALVGTVNFTARLGLARSC